MRYAAHLLAVALLAVTLPGMARAASLVFTGDPVDPGSGQPWEIQPGRPLVTAGPDGRLGTPDDALHAGIVGDVDLVVRLGPVPGGAAIPPPAVQRGSEVTAVAGARGVGTAVPFTVYLSNGAATPAAPWGAPLAAADMDGLPVVVAVFADRDGDGFVGPRGGGAAKTRPAREARALAELEPVGRAVALFTGGVATGTVVVTVGGPPSAGGVRLVATAMALTGSYDPGFFEGFVPNGPGVTTALPFLLDRDPARLFGADVGPLEVDGGTLAPELRPAALPDPTGALDLALPTDGSSATIDTARAVAGSAVCARLVEPTRGRGAVPAATETLVLGTAAAAGKTRLTLVAVDRLGNPTDPSPGMMARVVATGPWSLKPDKNGSAATEDLAIASARGKTVSVQASGAGSGSLAVFVGGARCQTIALSARPERNRGGSDALVARVGKADFTSIGAAVAAAADRNGDGRVTIEVADGVYRESVLVARAVELRGAGPGRTVIDARGDGPALELAHPAALVAGLTASGGTVGVAVTVAATVRDLEARANLGAGIAVLAAGGAAERCVARANADAGFSLLATGEVRASLAVGNAGGGVVAVTVGAVTVADSTSVANAGDGIEVVGSAAATVNGNRTSGNLGAGITLEETVGGVVAANRSAGNDGNGLRLNDAAGALVDANDLTANGGFGMRLSSSSADFDAAPGVQGPPGSNDVADNRKGPVEID